MKTLTTIIISIFFTATVSAKEITTNLEIINVSFVAATSLTAGANDNAVVLNWSAKNEISANRYEIERSFYSNNFSTIATLNIPFTNGTVKNYSINDNAASLTGRAVAYYRVKQTNAAGVVTYSNTMVVTLNGTDKSTVTTSSSSIRFSATQNGNAVIKVKSVTGQTAATINSIISKGTNTIELSNNFVKGIYVVEVAVNGVVVDTQKVIAE